MYTHTYIYTYVTPRYTAKYVLTSIHRYACINIYIYTHISELGSVLAPRLGVGEFRFKVNGPVSGDVSDGLLLPKARMPVGTLRLRPDMILSRYSKRAP